MLFDDWLEVHVCYHVPVDEHKVGLDEPPGIDVPQRIPHRQTIFTHDRHDFTWACVAGPFGRSIIQPADIDKLHFVNNEQFNSTQILKIPVLVFQNFIKPSKCVGLTNVAMI